MAYAVRMLTELCEEAAGAGVDSVRVCGGGARSALWNQLKATTLRRPVDVLETLEAGVLGATLLGMVAAASGELPELADHHVRVRTTIDPAPDAQVRADQLYAVYADTYRALEPLFPRLG